MRTGVGRQRERSGSRDAEACSLLHRFEVIDHDQNVVHSLKRHDLRFVGSTLIPVLLARGLLASIVQTNKTPRFTL